MKNRSLIWILSSLMVLFATIITISCNKKFDEPPATPLVSVDTSITNHVISIRALKKRHIIGGLERISDTVVITGIISGDDQSGNLYKQITIQDSTAGITLLLDRSGLFTDYPAGRRVYIKCIGLYISDYNYNIQLGILNNTIPTSPSLGSIPSSMFDNFIVKGSLNNQLTPRIVTLPQLSALAKSSNIPANDSLQGTLIQVNNVEFAASDVGLIYSDTSAAKRNVSRNITDCFSNTTVIYSSGYASFAGFPLPTGEGTLKGIYIPYKTNTQIVVRDTSDVQFYGLRCGPAVSTTLFSETFSGVTNKATITTTGSLTNVWQNIAEVGGVSYVGYVSGTTHLASVSAFSVSSTQNVITSWMITNAIKIPATITSPYLSFSTIDGHDNGATFQVMVSTDYNGSTSPSNSHWTALPATIPSGDSGFGTSTPSGNVDLSAYIGKTIYIGWRYDGTNTKNTTFEFGNVKVVGY